MCSKEDKLKRDREYMKKYREENEDYKQKNITNARKYYQENREKVIAVNKKWAENNREKVRKIKSKWAKNNRNKINKRIKEWRRSNPEMVRLNNATRRGKRDILIRVLNENFLQFGLTCCENCHTSIWERYEFDHIIPIALGGAGNYDNLQILCKPCNLEKMTDAIDFRRFIL